MSWQEQQARLLRQDLQLTIPEVSDNDSASPEYASYQMGEKGSLHSALRCPYSLKDDEERCHERYTQVFFVVTNPRQFCRQLSSFETSLIPDS